jgi:hypothetical protein
MIEAEGGYSVEVFPQLQTRVTKEKPKCCSLNTYIVRHSRKPFQFTFAILVLLRSRTLGLDGPSKTLTACNAAIAAALCELRRGRR